MENIETTTAPQSSLANKTLYQVTGKGYKQQFTDFDKAHTQYELLQKRAIKQKQTGSISLLVCEAGTEDFVVLEEIKISKEFFNKNDD